MPLPEFNDAACGAANEKENTAAPLDNVLVRRAGVCRSQRSGSGRA